MKEPGAGSPHGSSIWVEMYSSSIVRHLLGDAFGSLVRIPKVPLECPRRPSTVALDDIDIVEDVVERCRPTDPEAMRPKPIWW